MIDRCKPTHKHTHILVRVHLSLHLSEMKSNKQHTQTHMLCTYAHTHAGSQWQRDLTKAKCTHKSKEREREHVPKAERAEWETCTMYHRHDQKARTAEREQVPQARGAEGDVPCTKVMYQKLEYAKSLVHKPVCVCVTMCKKSNSNVRARLHIPGGWGAHTI